MCLKWVTSEQIYHIWMSKQLFFNCGDHNVGFHCSWYSFGTYFILCSHTCILARVIARLIPLKHSFESWSVFLQPFKKVCALYLMGSISQAIGTNDMLDSGLSAFSVAIHSLCDVLDNSHACLLLHHASSLMDAFEPSSTSRAQFLLAKSHYLLIAGKVRLSQGLH